MSTEQQIIALMVPLTAVLLSAGFGLRWVGGCRAVGVGHWAVGHMLFSLGLVLIAFRQDSPLPLTGAAGNLCAAGGLLAVRTGLRRFLGKGRLAAPWWGLLVGGLAFNVFFFDLPPAHLRIAANTGTIAILTFGLAWEFLRSHMEPVHRWAGGGLCLFVAAYLMFRAGGIAVSPEFVEPLAGGFHAAWAFVAMIVWTLPMRW